MTYCVAIRLEAGLVFLADSRTNAGVDHVATFRKMTVFEQPGERLMVLLAAGNLAITQAVRQIVCDHSSDPSAPSVWHASTMFDAARAVGHAVRTVWQRDAEALRRFGVDFNCSLLFGGQIRGEPMRLFQIYAAGNYIEATPETPYLQIGEAKYGKPILDRVIRFDMPLDEAAKCALVSMDSTLRSNVSVGLPLDLLVYEAGTMRVTRFVEIDERNPYMQMIRNTWGARLNQVFQEIPSPKWRRDGDTPGDAPPLETGTGMPVRAEPPAREPARTQVDLAFAPQPVVPSQPSAMSDEPEESPPRPPGQFGA